MIRRRLILSNAFVAKSSFLPRTNQQNGALLSGLRSEYSELDPDFLLSSNASSRADSLARRFGYSPCRIVLPFPLNLPTLFDYL